MKRILIIAGPNGAGKTTFALEYLPNEGGYIHFINADLIAAGLSPLDPDSQAVRAGRLMLEMMEDLAARGESFAFETTLSGRGYVRHVRRWKEQGYRVVLVYLALPTVEDAVERVAQRVKEGGHEVAPAVIRRRFFRGLENFRGVYCALVDEWMVFDNTSFERVMIERGSNP